MTSTEFRHHLQHLHLTQRGFARHVGMDPRTVRRWAAAQQDIPDDDADAIRRMGATRAELREVL